jgi:hypothetical protein
MPHGCGIDLSPPRSIKMINKVGWAVNKAFIYGALSRRGSLNRRIMPLKCG